jgi:hypothetical protein
MNLYKRTWKYVWGKKAERYSTLVSIYIFDAATTYEEIARALCIEVNDVVNCKLCLIHKGRHRENCVDRINNSSFQSYNLFNGFGFR